MSEPYHKIQSIYKRDPETKYKTFLEDQYTRPEFETLAHADWNIVEKIDGTNIRVMWDGEKVTFNGRTDNAQLHPGLLEHLTEKYTAEIFDGLQPLTIYGEGYGGKIQSPLGMQYRPNGTYSFIAFDIFMRETGSWWLRSRVEQFCEGQDIPVAPLIGVGTLDEAERFVKLNPDSIISPHMRMEGVVCTPTTQLFDRKGDRIITKIKCRDYTWNH